MSKTDKTWDLSYTQNRELSWLKFNARVMDEAMDPHVPLLERLRFLSIFTSNLDEFFMVRVGSLTDLKLTFPKQTDSKSGLTPQQQLEAIYEAVRPLIRYRDAAFAEISAELENKGVREWKPEELEGKNRTYIQDWYRDRIFPLLSPQIIDRSHPFPHLRNKGLYAAAMLSGRDRTLLGIVEVPESLPPIILLPGENAQYVRTEEVILSQLRKIFKAYHITEQCVVSVTRNADINYAEAGLYDEEGEDLRDYMVKALRKRGRLAPVRLEMQSDAPEIRKLLEQKLKLTSQQTYTCSCPLVLKYAYQLDKCDRSLYYAEYTPVYPDYLSKDYPLWPQIQQRDTLLFYPYQSMQPFLGLLREAANDPQVLSIQMTIYRLAGNSAVAKHLCTAAENGKSVTVLVELWARFDEENNIEWAKELEEAGCRVLYGIEGYKCHSKICLITRREKNGRLSYVTQIGTGNFNEKTAALYTDFALLTADPVIAEDAVNFFQNMLMGDLYSSYQKLLVAPFTMKDHLLRMIDGEIARGQKGHIIIKVNSVTERELIDKLAQASQAGVRVELIVRGICCLLPGIPGKTENITITSIVGRFLEHSRVYCFGDGELRQLYISSADIMTRNQNRRVEIACPVEDPDLKQWLSHYLEVLLSDNVKARRLLPSGEYVDATQVDRPPLSSQEYFMEHLPEFPAYEPPKQTFLDRFGKLFHR